MAGDSKVYSTKGDSGSGLWASIVKMVRGASLTDCSNILGSGVYLFFHGIFEISFLMSSGIIANLRDLLYE
jgi:hypothetical protein